MIRNVIKTLGSRVALVAAAGIPFLIAASADAQAPAPSPAAGEATAERVIVTGSYIPTAETETALPVTTYTAEVLQKAGANTPIEGLRQLPSFVGNAGTENDANAGDGAAGINLRGLGQFNTLILINGRRAFLGIGVNGAPDINAIPISAVSHVSVLKDGASAIYGSDAVAGVVNFSLLNGPDEVPYQGAEAYFLYGNTTDKDAHVLQAYLKGGVTGLDGKISIAAAGEYYFRAALLSIDRTISRTANLSNSPGGLGLGGINNNSPTFSGRVSISGAGSTMGFLTGQLVLVNLSQGGEILPGDYRRFEPTATSNPPGGTLPGDFPPGADPSRFNFQTTGQGTPSQEKSNYYVTGRYKVFGDAMQIYGDILYSHTYQDNQIAPSPFALGADASQSSPYNPFGSFITQTRYRLVQELGNRKSQYYADYYRYTAGINGNFNIKDNQFLSSFGYDTGFVYEQFNWQRIDSGDATFTAIANEIAAGNFNPFIGGSQGAPTSGTAPTYTIDPVTGAPVPTGLTQDYDNTAAAQRASYLGHSFFYERDYLVDLHLNAHFFPGLWNGGVDAAFGYEHRQLRQKSVPDPVQAAGDQLGFSQAPNTSTTQKVNSIWGELLVPVVTSTMNVPFIRSMDFDFAYRYEKFDDEDNYIKTNLSSFDNGGTPRITFRYEPIADLTLRASWGQSFLSPTPLLLFNPVNQNFPLLFDPLIGANIQPPEGVWQGGNVNLQPEKTDTWTAGFVWTPKFVPGFTMTLDWYQIYTRDLLLTAANSAQILLTQNVADPDGYGNGSGTIDGPGGPANGVTRDEFGNVVAIDADNSNAGTRFVQGIDLTAIYQLPTDHWGEFTFTLAWNHFFDWKAQPGVGDSHNFLGDFSQAFPLTPGAIPFNKALLRMEWQWKGWDFVVTGNYVGDYEDDPNFILGNDLVPGTPGTGDIPPSNNPSYILHRRVTDYETMDLQLSYTFLKPEAAPVTAGYSKDAKDAKSMPVAGDNNGTIWQRILWNTTITAGVNNVFDRPPPTLLGAFNNNYDTSNYTFRDRYYYVSLAKKF